MDYQKILPGVVIAGVTLFAVYRLSGQSSRTPIVSNALIPTSQPGQPIDRDPARVAGFSQLANVALGSQRLQEQSSSIAANLELGRFRLQEQSSVIQAGLQQGLAAQNSALELERIRQAGAQNRLNAEIADRAFDRELQQKALDQTFALAQQGGIQQGIGSILGALLNALRPPNRQSGASGGAGTPPTFPRPSRPTQQPQGRPDAGCAVFGIPVPCTVLPSANVPRFTAIGLPDIPFPSYGDFYTPRDLGFFGSTGRSDFDPFAGLLNYPAPDVEFPFFGGVGFGEPYLGFPGGDVEYGGFTGGVGLPSYGDFYSPRGFDFGDPFAGFYLTDPFDFGGGAGGGFGDFGDYLTFEDFYA